MIEPPFRFGGVVDAPHFVDRADELTTLASDLRVGQDVVLFSRRRYGKTSLVQRAIATLRAEGALVAYADLRLTPTRERLADHLATAIHDGLLNPGRRALYRAGEIFQKLPLRPRITIGPDGSPSFEFGVAENPRDVDRTLADLLEVPAQIAVERRRRVVLVLDEFQEVIEMDRHLPALLRSVFQQQVDVAHVFLGSKRHLLQRVFTDANEPLYRLAKPMVLSAIPPEFFVPYIRERFLVTGSSIEADAIDAIVEIAGGHPNDTQELCHFTWTLASASGEPATRATVDDALQQVLAAEDDRLAQLVGTLAPHQRLLLRAIAQDGKAVYAEAYRRRHRLGASAAVQRSIQRLVERDLIERERGEDATYSVPDVFLRAWLRTGV